MKIRGASLGEVQGALDEASSRFRNNVRFAAEPKEIPYENCYRVTLGVIDPDGPGALYSRPEVYGYPKPTYTACWHVHACFFEALPWTASVKSHKEAEEGVWIPRDGGQWEDFVVGSQILYWQSDLCTCEHGSGEIKRRGIPKGKG